MSAERGAIVLTGCNAEGRFCWQHELPTDDASELASALYATVDELGSTTMIKAVFTQRVVDTFGNSVEVSAESKGVVRLQYGKDRIQATPKYAREIAEAILRCAELLEPS